MVKKEEMSYTNINNKSNIKKNNFFVGGIVVGEWNESAKTALGILTKNN